MGGIYMAGGAKAWATTAVVGLGAAGIGALFARDANLSDPSGKNNRTLTIAAGATAAATGGLAAVIGVTGGRGEGTGAVLAAVAAIGLGFCSYISAGVAAGSLGVDLLDVGQR
jgi:hypothetical protein